jgi:hypothetical protein
LFDKIEKNGMGRHCSRYGRDLRLTRGFVAKSEGKIPNGRPRRRWEDNIKMISRKWDVGTLTGWSWLRIRTAERNVCMQY